MKIAFWSPMHGTGATASLLAVATVLSEINRKKILITHTHYNLNNLERPLLGNIRETDYFRDTGMDAVIRYFRSGNITKEQISDCSIKITDNLFLLAGTKNSSREGYESGIVQNMILHIISRIEQYYDIVFVDTNSGKNENSLRIIEDCDMVIITLRQDRYLLDGLFEGDLPANDNIFYLFGDYCFDSKYSLANICHIYKKIKKSNSGIIPHNSAFKDAICDEKVLKYLTWNHETNSFFDSLLETTEKLMVFIDEILMKKNGGMK